MEERIESYLSLATVFYRRDVKYRTITIKLEELKGIIVTFPKRMSFKEAEAFVFAKEQWIQKHLTKVRAIEKQYTIFDENTKFRTRDHNLRIKTHDKAECKARIKNGEILILYPATMNVKNKQIQLFIRRAIEETWRLEGRRYLTERTQQFANRFQLSYAGIIVRNTKQQWGSCSSDNKICYSLHLMNLPQNLIDYVILHELAHTRHKNHSHNFWAFLNQLTSNAKKLAAELENYRIGIY